MPTNFVITAKGNVIQNDLVNKGEAIEYSFDFSPWAEDNSDLETVTWTVKYGQVSVTNTADSDNIATALLTFSQSGGNLVEIKAEGEDGEIVVTNLDVMAKDQNTYSDDYGFCG